MSTITEALRAARACIQQDRTSLADTGMRHDNTMEPDAAAGVAEYDAVLQQIDAALAGMTHHITDEQIAKLACEVGFSPALVVTDGGAFGRLVRTAIALAAPAPQGEPIGEIVRSFSNGSGLDVRLFGRLTSDTPGIVGTKLYTAPAVPSDEPAEFERAYNRLFRGRGVDTRHISDCEAVWMARAALTAAPTQPAQSEPVQLGELAKRNVYDAIRGAYDLGYNDARNARAVPGDSAPDYEGRSVEADHGGALINSLNRRLRSATAIDAARKAEKGGA